MDLQSDGTPEKLIAQGCAYPVVVCGTLLLLAFAVFGQRMNFRAIRWHTINLCVWNVAYMVLYASYGMHTPWKGFIIDKKLTTAVYTYTHAALTMAFPIGTFFVMLETFLIFAVPTLEHNLIVSAVFALLIFIGGNAGAFVPWYISITWTEKQINKAYGFQPVYTMVGSVIIAFGIALVAYLFIAIVANILSCAIRRKRNQKQHTYELWSLFFYGLIPYIFICLTNSIQMLDYFTYYFEELVQQITDMVMYMMNPTAAPTTVGPTPVGTTTPPAPTTPKDPMADIRFLMFIANLFIETLTWSESVLPLLEAALTCLAFPAFGQQFLSFICCGRLFHASSKRPPLREMMFFRKTNREMMRPETVKVMPVTIIPSPPIADVSSDSPPPKY